MRWEVDDGPASWYTRIYRVGMRLRRDKRAFEGSRHTLAVARDRQARGDAGPGRLTRATRRLGRREVPGLSAWLVRPRRRAPVVRVLYVHGGGYVHPLTRDYWRLFRTLTSGRSPAPAEVVVPAYPLAPEATVDDVLPRLLDLYDALVADGAGQPIVLMGDSAGGALVLAMACRLRDRGAGPSGTCVRPARLVLLSPWLDGELEERSVADLEPTDPMLAESGLRAAARWWSGARPPSDPLVSPVHADLGGLPPADVFIGAHDILRPAVDELVGAAGRDGLALTVHERTAMFHVWMTRAIPEGRRTRRELAALLGPVADSAATRSPRPARAP